MTRASLLLDAKDPVIDNTTEDLRAALKYDKNVKQFSGLTIL